MPSALKKLIDSITKSDKGPKPNMCKCSACESILNVNDTIKNYDHHDGWEMPAYTIDECPNCKDGGLIENYWFSRSLND